MGTVVMCEQGTVEWKLARAGHVTGSKMSDVLTMLKKPNDEGNYDSQARKNYKAQLIAELLTGEPQDEDIGNIKAVRRGKEFESLARAVYEMRTGNFVDPVGFVQHATIPRLGCSPDGLVGDVGMVEFKVPAPPTHVRYLLGGVLPGDYEPQVHMELACCEERQWNDFMSFCPEMPDRLQCFIVRVERNPKRVSEMEDVAMQFNAEIDAVIARLKGMYV